MTRENTRTRERRLGEQLVAAYHELSLRPVRGLEAQALHELLDPDTRVTPNAVTRLGGGFELYPTVHTEVQALYRHAFAPAEAALHPETVFSAAMGSSDELTVLFHLFL